jgi:hypothetical protein
MMLEIWQVAVIAALCVAAIWVAARVASIAYFKSKREHTKALLRDMDVQDDGSNPKNRKDTLYARKQPTGTQ